MVAAFLHPFAKPARPAFIPLVRGEGARVWTADGQELIDAMASLWYCNVGHGRTRDRRCGERTDANARDVLVLRAVHQRAGRRTVGAGRRRSPRSRDSRVFLCGSGSEAVDTSIKLARLAQRLAGHPERTVIISRERGYHGTNLGGTSAQGIAPNREGWGPLVPEVIQVPSDDIEALSVLMSDPRRRDRRCAHRAGAGRRRRLATGRRLPRRGARAVRPARRAAGVRRGDHRVRPPRHLVRAPTTSASRRT